MRITRRAFLQGGITAAAGTFGLGGYAFAVEPHFRLIVQRWDLPLPGWPAGYPPLRIAVLTDLHACEPWMPAQRIERIVARTMRLNPDIVLVLGDMVASMERFGTQPVPPAAWGRALGGLKAPLGVHAVLGNHDWWSDVDAVLHGFDIAGIPVYENTAVRLRHRGRPFWLAGLGDQIAYPSWGGGFRGLDDLPGTLAQVANQAPVILMAHEPDIFVDVPARVTLTLAGHTHGGQVNLPLIGSPVVPSAYGQRFVYGHIVEDDRHMVVSAGLGCSVMPVRFGRPPEITLVTVRARPPAAA